MQAHALFNDIHIPKKSLEVSASHNFHLISEFLSKCSLTCAKYFDASKYSPTNEAWTGLYNCVQ